MSDGKKYYCFCGSNCKYETMTKEQILAAITQAASGSSVIDPDAAVVSKVKETNSGGAVTFWVGTQAEYNALESVAKDCLYIITNDSSVIDLQNAMRTLEEATAEAHAAAAEATAEAHAATEHAAAAAEHAAAAAENAVEESRAAAENAVAAAEHAVEESRAAAAEAKKAAEDAAKNLEVKDVSESVAYSLVTSVGGQQLTFVSVASKKLLYYPALKKVWLEVEVHYEGKMAQGEQIMFSHVGGYNRNEGEKPIFTPFATCSPTAGHLWEGCCDSNGIYFVAKEAINCTEKMRLVASGWYDCKGA